MERIEILLELAKNFGKIMTLEQALEASARISDTEEVLEKEGHEYNQISLIKEIGQQILDEI